MDETRRLSRTLYNLRAHLPTLLTLLAAPMSLNDVETSLYWVFVARLTSLSAHSIIVYDHLITLGDEVEYIWKAPRWSLGKVMFVLIRYYNLVCVVFQHIVLFYPRPSDKLCEYWLRWAFISTMLAMFGTEIILQMRIYAMYEGSKRMLAFLVCTFSATVISTTVLTTLNIVPRIEISASIGDSHFCERVNDWGAYPEFYIPVILFEMLLCGLALYKKYEVSKHMIWGRTFGVRTMQKLIKGSILYFLVVFVIYFTGFLTWIVDIGGNLVTSNYLIPLSTTLCLRLLLSIRKTCRRPALPCGGWENCDNPEWEPWLDIHTVSEMETLSTIY